MMIPTPQRSTGYRNMAVGAMPYQAVLLLEDQLGRHVLEGAAPLGQGGGELGAEAEVDELDCAEVLLILYEDVLYKHQP